MKPLALVLAEAGLELVPKAIQGHPAVVKNARRRNKSPSEVLLDISLHYRAMKGLDRWYKRGRPDIVHISLLNALSSPLNVAGLLRVYVHTINNVIIYVDPGTRIPRNYNRFVGLMEQLLALGRVPPNAEKPLMWVEAKSLREFVLGMGFEVVIVMHERGVLRSPRSLGEDIAKLMGEDRGVCIVVGAFQEGDFESEVFEMATQLVSIYPRPLDAWIVVSRVLEGVEEALGIYQWSVVREL